MFKVIWLTGTQSKYSKSLFPLVMKVWREGGRVYMSHAQADNTYHSRGDMKPTCSIWVVIQI